MAQMATNPTTFFQASTVVMILWFICNWINKTKSETVIERHNNVYKVALENMIEHIFT